MKKEKQKKSVAWWVIVVAIVGIGGVVFLVSALALVMYLWQNSDMEGTNKTSIGLGEVYNSQEAVQGVPSVPMERNIEEEQASVGETAVDSDKVDLGEEQKIIKTGSLSLVVNKVEESAEEMAKITEEKKGFVESSAIKTDKEGKQSGTVIIRVPVKDFNMIISEIKQKAEQITNETLSGQDVTEDFVDLQARLKNSRAEEEQYIKILEQANSVDDILKVTKQLSNIREEIEILEGRIKYLENKTDLATITIYLTQEPSVSVPTKEWRPLDTLKNASQAWIKALQVFIDVMIWLIIFLTLPTIVVWLIAWRIKKRKGRK